MLFSGFLMTRLTKLARLPNVTAYILAGILIGPYVLNLVPQRIIDGTDFLSDIALAFIAFSTGEFFKLDILKRNGMKVVWITILEAVLASVFIFILTYFVLRLDLAFSIVLAALASATAPASTMMTIRQTGAKGDFVDTLLQVVALDENEEELIMENTQVLLNIVWTMVGAFLVYFMQAGFAMVETGFTRAKNSGNILMKNMMDFVLGSIFFFIIGFALMFGGSNAFIGTAGFFHPKSLADADGMFNGLPIGVFMIFQTVFCATSATIVSGAMAERTKFISYLIYSAAISVFIYPITGHWIWGGGWLSQIGFHDFAGSTAVHMVGGLCALAGAKMVGPRIGKYTKEGKPVAIPGHNLPLGALGVFILWFCWFGFNCGSTTAATYNLGDIAMITNLAAAAATLVTLIVTWVRYGKPDISMTMNGALAGLVAITASCDVVNDYEALFIGAVAGVVVVFAVEFFDKVVKIDDPVGAISVHGVCGALGTLFTGIFGEGCSFITQLIGFVAVAAYTLILAFILFFVLKKTIGLRVTEKEEIDGLDMHEHGCSAYANFHFHNDK